MPKRQALPLIEAESEIIKELDAYLVHLGDEPLCLSPELRRMAAHVVAICLLEELIVRTINHPRLESVTGYARRAFNSIHTHLTSMFEVAARAEGIAEDDLQTVINTMAAAMNRTIERALSEEAAKQGGSQGFVMPASPGPLN